MDGRVVAVTGGHGVLGRAVVQAALARGWRVAVIDHAMGHSAPDGALEIGGVDLTDPAQAGAAVGRVIERFGRLDALLNIAGGFIGAALTQNDSLYRIPGLDGANHQTRIDARQTKLTVKGEYRPDYPVFDLARMMGRAG